MIQAEKLASLGQLAASVVHEINNPMTAVADLRRALLRALAGCSPDADPADVEKLRKIIENSRAHPALHPRPGVLRAPGARTSRSRSTLNAVLEQAVGFCEHVLHASTR